MCWKQEWAAAVNNLNWAILHINRAKTKLEKRSLNDLKKPLSPADIDAAKKGLEKCKEIIASLEASQEELKWLIENVGLWRKDSPKRTKVLMAGRRKTSGRPWEP